MRNPHQRRNRSPRRVRQNVKDAMNVANAVSAMNAADAVVVAATVKVTANVATVASARTAGQIKRPGNRIVAIVRPAAMAANQTSHVATRAMNHPSIQKSHARRKQQRKNRVSSNLPSRHWKPVPLKALKKVKVVDAGVVVAVAVADAKAGKSVEVQRRQMHNQARNRMFNLSIRKPCPR